MPACGTTSAMRIKGIKFTLIATRIVSTNEICAPLNSRRMAYGANCHMGRIGNVAKEIRSSEGVSDAADQAGVRFTLNLAISCRNRGRRKGTRNRGRIQSTPRRA